MNKKRVILIVVVLVTLLAVGAGVIYAQNGYGRGRQGQPGNGQNGTNNSGWLTGLPPAVEGELPADVITAMNAGLLDEYIAYATYQAIIDQFGAIRPFVNIQRAEVQHAAAWEFLFERYGLPLPEAPAALDVEFASLSEACQVAAAAEIANFGLYDTMLETFNGYPDLLQVTTALRDASEFNHLPAFERCAAR